MGSFLVARLLAVPKQNHQVPERGTEFSHKSLLCSTISRLMLHVKFGTVPRNALIHMRVYVHWCVC